MRSATYEVLDAAYTAGVRWVDVARSYGLAERFLAEWLAEHQYTDVQVSSKWGYAYVGQWRVRAQEHETKEHSLARFWQQWQETQDLLGSWVGLYQVHSLTADSPLFDDRRLVGELASLAQSGVTVGFTASGPAQADVIRKASQLEVDGQRVFGAVQATWNLLEPSAGAALAEAHAAGMRVLCKETLANGRLVVAPPGPLDTIAAGHGAGVDAIAVAAALAQPWADVVLLGSSSSRQLTANTAATRIGLAEHELDALAQLRESPADYWARRSRLTWQ